jgi:hypothetical protein
VGGALKKGEGVEDGVKAPLLLLLLRVSFSAGLPRGRKDLNHFPQRLLYLGRMIQRTQPLKNREYYSHSQLVE